MTLTLLSTFATAFIFGINTLFLLSAGLNNTQAFAANAFFTAGQVIFEVPTGVVADVWGRRFSFLLGAASLMITTLIYWLLWHSQAPFYQWAIVSALLGLGYTFFSGATEAWLVDALQATGFTGSLESIFAKGQISVGIAMLAGSVGGGVIAQFTNLGVPYLVRAGFLLVLFLVAYLSMRDLGWQPVAKAHPIKQVKHVLNASIEHGWRNKPVRWLMIAEPFLAGVSYYGFYAIQPYLLELSHRPNAYSIAGAGAAIVAASQIAGGLAAPWIKRHFKKRSTVLLGSVVMSATTLGLLGVVNNFWLALGLIVVWGLTFAATVPVRQAFINKLIPSEQRATVLSFDSLMSSAGGVFTQPGLGRVADAFGYGVSYSIAGATQLVALPCLWIVRKTRSRGDNSNS